MIDEILRNNLIIREWVNGSLLPLNLSLVFAIGLFLWSEFAESIDAYSLRKSWATFQARNGVQTGCALFWIFLADGMRAGGAWIALRHGADLFSGILFLTAGPLALLACLRCIYLFTPPEWGHWFWIGAVAVTALFQLVT